LFFRKRIRTQVLPVESVVGVEGIEFMNLSSGLA